MQEDIVTDLRKRPYFEDSRTVKKPKTMQNTGNLKTELGMRPVTPEAQQVRKSDTYDVYTKDG